MKKSEDDVFLSDGEGYMVESTPYGKHLEASMETKQVRWLPQKRCDLVSFPFFAACHMCKSQGCESSQLQ